MRFLQEHGFTYFNDTFSVVIYMHKAVIGYLEVSYAFWRENSGHSKSALERFWMLFHSPITKKRINSFRREFLSLFYACVECYDLYCYTSFENKRFCELILQLP